jgi:arylsulfatase A-like enzyme
MTPHARRSLPWLFVLLLISSSVFGSAYDAHPKLIVVITVDQLRADLLQRHKAKFTDGGFRLLMDRGAYFTDCYYDYVNLHTAPGHATLFTGAYTDGHSIIANEWWDHTQKKAVTSVEDANTKTVGGATGETGSSPHNLTATTIGDELRLATEGKARVYGVSLKDRSAILPAGHSGVAYWIDRKTGAWITSTYYMPQLPEWAAAFNGQKRADKYWGLEWTDAAGKKHMTTKPTSGSKGFYDVVGDSPYGVEYEMEFARDLVTSEKLGSGPATDLLSVSISSFDITGHEFGPDSPAQQAMLVATDKYLNDFFSFLGRQVGYANLWIVLSADHGIAPTLQQAEKLHIPDVTINRADAKAELNNLLAQRLGRKAEYLATIADRNVYLNRENFGTMKRNEAEALVAELMRTPAVAKKLGIDDAVTVDQVQSGRMPRTDLARRWAHSVAPRLDEWYVMGLPSAFSLVAGTGTDHTAPWSYDTHVPLGFYGVAFVPGTYRTAAQPVDWSVTLASLLGINKPSHAVGRVLTEAIKETPRTIPAKEQP